MQSRFPDKDPANRFTYSKSIPQPLVLCQNGCTKCRRIVEYDPNTDETIVKTILCQIARHANLKLMNLEYAHLKAPRDYEIPMATPDPNVQHQ